MRKFVIIALVRAMLRLMSRNGSRTVAPAFRGMLALACLVLLQVSAGCGGGSGSSGGPPPLPPDFTLAATPNSANVPPGGALAVRVSITGENGFSGSVTVNVTGAPTGTTISPSVPFTMAPGSQNVTLLFPANAPQGNYSVAVQASSGSLQHSSDVALQIQQQALANFSLSLNNSELSFAQGGSGSTIVGLSATSSGSTNYEVEFSIAGLPSGVQATWGTNPLAMGQPATGLTLTAGSNAGLTNYATVTVVGTRTPDGNQQSATFLLNVTPAVGTLPAIRTDFVREDGTPAAAVYDSVHNVVYASNPEWNRVDVISPSTHQIVNSISAPSPTGMDISLDGTQLVVASNVNQIVSIDTNSLQVVKRTNVPLLPGGAATPIPGLLVNTSNGTALVGMTLNSSPPAYFLEQWNPATGAFTALSAPGVTVWINQLVRTGDGAKALVVGYSSANMAVYDAASNSFTASGQSPVGDVFGVAGSPTAHQFAISGSNGVAIVDANLNTLANLPLSEYSWYFFGMVYSPDGTKLYAALEIYTLCGPNYPVLLTFETSHYSLTGVAPAFAEQAGVPCNPPEYFQASPLAADNSGLVFSNSSRVNTPYTHGLVIDDATNLQNLLNLPGGPPFPSMNWTDEAPLNETLATGLGNIAFDVLPDVWFGNTRGTNIQFNVGLVSVTAPSSATAGLVNVKAVLPDGWFSLDPQSFSYGSKVLFLGGNAASTQGGAALALIGYGLLGNNGTAPSVAIGGQAAEAMAFNKYVYFNDSGFNSIYPFTDVDEVLVTVPPGTGVADVTVTSEAGKATLSKVFNYLLVSDYPSTDTLTYLLYDPQRHWVYLSAGNHIDVFSADTQQFLTPIVPPTVSGARQIRGLALTPDNSKLLAANFADISVAIIDPDNPSSSTAVQIPVTITNAPGVADVVATSTRNVFVDGVSGTFAGCGGQLYELNLATLQVTLRSDLGFSGLQVGGNNFSRNTAGNLVFLAGSCASFLWNAATDTFIPGLAGTGNASSGDGYWFVSDYTRLDAQMIEHMQAQVPEFFSIAREFTDWAGEKMNASGSILYTPVPTGPGNAESNGVDVTDTNRGTWLGNILLTEQMNASQVAQSLMDYDETGSRLFIITNKGLTVVQLANPPLSIGYLNPSTGSASGGTAVTIRGSGFESGATVSFGGASATTTFIDGSTLNVVTPTGSAGGARVSVQNPDGTFYSLDAGFAYQ